VYEDYIVSPLKSLELNALSPSVHDMGLRDDSFDIVLHMHPLEGVNLRQSQDQLARLNEFKCSIGSRFLHII
jgi:hypothetical protein